LLDLARDVAVQAALRLSIKLRLRDLHADNSREAFADVVAGERLLIVFDQAGLLAEVIDRAGEGGTEAAEVSAAVDGVDVVGKAEKRFRIAIVVLQGYFDPDCADAAGAGLFAFHVDRLIVQNGFAAVQVLDELGNAAVIDEFGILLGVFALVRKRDLETFIEERELAQTLSQGIEVELRHGHDGRVRLEIHLRAVLASGFAGRSETAFGNAALVVLFPRQRIRRGLFGGTPDL